MENKGVSMGRVGQAWDLETYFIFQTSRDPFEIIYWGQSEKGTENMPIVVMAWKGGNHSFVFLLTNELHYELESINQNIEWRFPMQSLSSRIFKAKKSL